MMRPKIKPTVSIYWKPGTDAFLIEEYVDDPSIPGLLMQWGDGTRITREQLSMEGYDLVSRLLDEFSERSCPDDYQPPTMDLSEDRRFVRQHLSISVRRSYGGLIEIDPTERGTGYKGALPEDRIVLEEPVDNEVFYEALMEAFKRCT